MSEFYLPAIRIRGFRSFRDVLFRLNRLEVIIGANGTGKSSLFAFLRFLRDSCTREIPPGITQNSFHKNVFHKPGPSRFFWNAQIDFQNRIPIFYQAEIEAGSNGPTVLFERILTKKSLDTENLGGFSFLDFREGRGLVRDPEDMDFLRKEWVLSQGNLLGLGAITDASLKMLYGLRSYIRQWRFYKGAEFNFAKIRCPVPPTLSPILDEDWSNLGAVLYYLMARHSDAFEDLKSLIRFALPEFRNLSVRPVGGNGEVMMFWEEEGVEAELSFADLSDGIIRFIGWATLCIVPVVPTLICMDDPGQGLHPRTLPILAGLFEKISERTQVLLATHTSCFLGQFDLENISIMKKTSGGSAFVNIRNAQAIYNQLQKVSAQDIEDMYRADELEAMF